MYTTQSESSKRRSLLTLIAIGIMFILVTGGMIWGINAIGVETIRETIASAGPFAPLLYIVIKAATYVFAPLTSGPIQVGAGIIFEPFWGIVYTVIGEAIGGSVAFLIARRFGRPVVKRLLGDDGLARVETFVSQIVDWKTLLYARIILFALFDFISYAAGFSRVRYRTYLIIALTAGTIPTAVAVLLGSAWTENSNFLLIYGLLAVACIVPLLLNKPIRRLLKMDVNAGLTPEK